MRYKAYDGKTVIYAHLQSVCVNENDSIRQGDVVAYSGNTGASTGPHLHFGVYDGGKSVDPRQMYGE